MIIALDSGPLGMVTNPAPAGEAAACAAWLEALLAAGHEVVVPEIADYEIRRELLRAGRTKGLARLDELEAELRYLPITTEVERLACALWAQIRNAGTPTAGGDALDGDVILAAQATILERAEGSVLVATGNLKHLDRVCSAKHWNDGTWV